MRLGKLRAIAKVCSTVEVDYGDMYSICVDL